MFRFVIIFLLLNFYNPSFSSPKEKIISKMKLINALSFDFVQSINKKNKNGFCIIKYSKKIFCEYGGPNKKIIVSNGRSLVIKNENSGNYNIYPLNKTPFDVSLLIIIASPELLNIKFFETLRRSLLIFSTSILFS